MRWRFLYPIATPTILIFRNYSSPPCLRGLEAVEEEDSLTTQLGLIKQTLKAESQNEPLRQLLLLAAQLDIKIEPHHLPGEENGLADALSRDLQDRIANWCPHWQNSFHSLSRQ